MPDVVLPPPFLRRALATLSVLLLGTVSAVSVWLPEGRQAATLDAQGLRLPAGALLSVLGPAEPATVPGQRVRIVPSPRPGTSARLESVKGRGTVLASIPLPPGVSALTGTRRGPCFTRAGSDPLTFCLSPDLKTEWVSFRGDPLLITSSGDTAYLTHPPKRGASYTRDVPVIRLDLRTSARTTLTVNAELGDSSPADRRAVAITYDANNVVRGGRELSGNRFVACVSVSLAKYDCRLTVFDQDAHPLRTLSPAAYVFLPSVAADGHTLYALGNTLHVWDANTGRETRRLLDPLWAKLGLTPASAFLSPDVQQAAVVLERFKNGSPDSSDLTVMVYDLRTGQRLQSFAVQRP